MAPTSISRLAWIDWMRGLACVLMFQTHCYDSWLGGGARDGAFLMYSHVVGTLPAPLFLFLAGTSFALVIDKLVRRNTRAGEITRTMFRRGAEIFGFGLLFRLQEYLISWGWAPWTDLFRVDILNVIGLSMMLMALACGAALWLTGRQHEPPRRALLLASLLGATSIALLAPPLWTNWRPLWLPWPIESYVNGVHHLGAPQPGLFPVFPWAAFAFAGLAAGFVLFSDWSRTHPAQTLAIFGGVGVALIAVARWFDHLPVQIYPVYDYWHTSPNFFLMRVGLLLLIAFLSYAWCRWGFGALGFSPLIQLGQTSLLVYWVHIELVYGRFSLLPKRGVGIAVASLGLLVIFLAMLALSMMRTRVDWKTWAESARLKISAPKAVK